MKSLKERIGLIKDLKRQHEISCRRFFNRDSESIVLNLINKELVDYPIEHKLPRKLYAFLSRIDKNNSISIEKLCEIYREIIIIKERIKR